VLNGKEYARTMRVHKTTFQVMWRIIITFFMEFIGEGKRKQIEEITNSDVKNLTNHLNDSMATFIDS